METRASYTLVGAFILILMVGMAGFVVWLAKFNSDVRYNQYQVLFAGSVTGLNIDSPVRYRGIPVGTVRTIEIDPDNPNRIRVVIQVASTTPIKSDTVASIEMQGITGVAFVQLTGGSKGAPTLVPRPGEQYATITAANSALQEVVKSAPELLASATQLMNSATALLSEDNRASVSKILANVRDISGEIAANKGALGKLITDAQATMANVRETSDNLKVVTGDLKDNMTTLVANVNATVTQLQTTLANVDRTVQSSEPKVRELVDNLQATSKSMRHAAETVATILDENRQPIDDFAQSGLYEFNQFVIDARALVASLTQIADQIERDPTSFFLGGNQQGYKAQ